MQKQKIEHHIERLKEKHKDLELDLMEAHAQWNDTLAAQIKKEKLKLKDEIEKLKTQIS